MKPTRPHRQMSTQKNEHNPDDEIDGDRCDGQCMSRTRAYCSATTEDRFGNRFICTKGHNHLGPHIACADQCNLHIWPLTIMEKFNAENAKQIGDEIRRRITPPTDTTGSGREGETATPECDAELAGRSVRVISAKLGRKLERQRDAALAQVEALRREKALLPADWMKDSSLETWFPLSAQTLKERQEDAKLLAWMNRERLTVTWNPHHDAFIVQRYDQVCGNIGVGKTVIEALRAAIDSAQRQEGR